MPRTKGSKNKTKKESASPFKTIDELTKLFGVPTPTPETLAMLSVLSKTRVDLSNRILRLEIALSLVTVAVLAVFIFK